MSTIKNILSKISIHPSCYFLIVLSLLSGYFNLIAITTILLLIHECAHFFTAYFFNWEVDKIVFYPYGGVSKFNHEVNCPIKEELIVLLMGPIMQLGCYLVLMNIPYLYNYQEIIKTINYSILTFNLLPIYPLDGGRIMQLLICYLTSYNLSFKIIYFISFIFLSLITLIFFYHPTINILLIIILLVIKLISEKRNTNYYLEKFILERYLHKYKFKKSKIVKRTKDFKRDYHHLIKINDKYFLEEEYLLRKYKDKL